MNTADPPNLQQGDEEEDVDIVKDVDDPAGAEILAIWAQVIEDIRQSKVCFYPGQVPGQNPALDGYTGALPLIGDCSTLVYAEPRRSKIGVWNSVNQDRLNLQVPIDGLGFITSLEMKNTGKSPGADFRGLFRDPGIEWELPEAKPPPNRFWGEYAELTIEVGREQKHVRLLHIGVGGLAAVLYFFQPHQIVPARVIGTAF
ncbi:MAG: hypothetical protein ACLQAH_01225 [Limisphaerales bacterium]